MQDQKPNNSSQPLMRTEMERLLAEQTSVILQTVGEKLAVQKVEIIGAVDKRLEQLEHRFLQKLDQLTTTLDRFLKRLTDVEEEFTFMKNDINRIKRYFARSWAWP